MIDNLIELAKKAISNDETKTIEIGLCNFSKHPSMASVAATIESALKEKFPGIECKFDMDNFQFVITKNGGNCDRQIN